LLLGRPGSRLRIETAYREQVLSGERVERRLAAILAADVAGTAG